MLTANVEPAFSVAAAVRRTIRNQAAFAAVREQIGAPATV